MRPTRFHMLLLTLLTCALMLGPWFAYADSDRDHDQARQAMASGQILSLRAILDLVEPAFPGQILEVELERKHNELIYELKVLQADAMIIKIKVDAKNGKILGTKKDSAK